MLLDTRVLIAEILRWKPLLCAGLLTPHRPDRRSPLSVRRELTSKMVSKDLETVSVRESSSVWRPAIATLVPTAGHAHVCERLRNRIAEAGALVVFGGSIEP